MKLAPQLDVLWDSCFLAKGNEKKVLAAKPGSKSTCRQKVHCEGSGK